jgi:hypothetical protein
LSFFTVCYHALCCAQCFSGHTYRLRFLNLFDTGNLTGESKRIKMNETEQDEIREAFEEHMKNQYTGWHESMFARNEIRYFDSQVEDEWQAFQAGFNYAKGEK